MNQCHFYLMNLYSGFEQETNLVKLFLMYVRLRNYYLGLKKFEEGTNFLHILKIS